MCFEISSLLFFIKQRVNTLCYGRVLCRNPGYGYLFLSIIHRHICSLRSLAFFLFIKQRVNTQIFIYYRCLFLLVVHGDICALKSLAFVLVH